MKYTITLVTTVICSRFEVIDMEHSPFTPQFDKDKVALYAKHLQKPERQGTEQVLNAISCS